MTDLDELRVSWAALAAGPGPGGRRLATLALADPLPEGPVLLGLDLDGRRHLLVPRVPTEPAEEDRGSDAVQIVSLTLGEGREATDHTDVVCSEPELADVFDDLILAILREIADNELTPNRSCIQVLDRWRSMMRPPRREPLSVNQMAGLVAELHLALAILRRDPDRRIDVWTGPAGARHDFRRGAHAIEVKVTLSAGENATEIHGIEQLDPPQGGELHLAWFRLERVPGGSLTVAGLVEALRRLVGGSPQVYDRLLDAGWRPESAAEHVAFELREERIHAVHDEFPRLVPDMLPGGRVPGGVSNVRYTVNLDAEGVAPLGPEQRETLLDTIATADAGP
jgi:putative PD-(D/E)XK family protein DUF4420